MPMNFFPGQQAKPGGGLMVMPTYPEPIMSIPPFGISAANTSMPRSLPQFVSPPMPQLQTTTVTSSPVGPLPQPYAASANMEEALSKMKDDLHKMFVESFGIEPKVRGRTYQKPYPSYFDAITYPQGYKVPEFF